MRFPLHKHGAIRYVRRFAFVPVCIGKVRVWLEWYYVKQTFRNYEAYDGEVRRYWDTEKKLLPEDPEMSPLMKALK